MAAGAAIRLLKYYPNLNTFGVPCAPPNHDVLYHYFVRTDVLIGVGVGMVESLPVLLVWCPNPSRIGLLGGFGACIRNL